MRTEWVIHIWGKEREQLEFTPQEKFHIDMIKSFDHSIFDKVLINIAMDNIDDESLFSFLNNELLKVFSDIKEVEIKKCQNDRKLSEYVTFRPYVWNRIGENVRIFYSHFKGYVSNVMLLRESYPSRNVFINEYYWSYLMYRMSLDKEYIDEMKKTFDSGNDIYCWCLIDESNFDHRYIQKDNFYTSYFRSVEKNVPYINDYYFGGNMYVYSPGSFVWYDLKNIYNHIGCILDKISLNDNILISSSATSHFCELYIYRFLNIENIKEQSIINNMRNQYSSIRNSPYTKLYCSKNICKEYIKDFDKYIIQNKII